MAELRPLFSLLHIVAGIVALTAFWFPLAYKKGGKAHRTAGWIFVAAMSVIIVTGMLMLSLHLMAGRVDQALFLGFLVLISFAAVYGALRVLRAKQSPKLMLTWDNLLITLLVLAFGLYLLYQFFFVYRFPLWLVFGIVGLTASVPELWKWVRPPAERVRYWWFEHMRGMIIAGMAAHIAFFAFGSTRIWPDLYDGQPWWVMLIPWTSPFVVAFIAITLLERHYTRKFSGA